MYVSQIAGIYRIFCVGCGLSMCNIHCWSGEKENINCIRRLSTTRPTIPISIEIESGVWMVLCIKFYTALFRCFHGQMFDRAHFTYIESNTHALITYIERRTRLKHLYQPHITCAEKKFDQSFSRAKIIWFIFGSRTFAFARCAIYSRSKY